MDYRNQEQSAYWHGNLATVADPGWNIRLRKRLGLLRRAVIQPYRGHGTANSLQIKGRVIESPGKKSDWFKRNNQLHNFFTTLREFRSREIAGARVEARYRGQRHRFYTDSEGYFMLNLWFPDEPLESGWHEVKLRLLDSIGGSGTEAVAPSFVPSENANFAVISDLDDTVINSSAFNKITQIRLTLFKDAASRTVVEDVVPLYQRLASSGNERAGNPIFYLSRSGWNLNGLLQEFLDLNELPRGPMFLRDLAWREAKSIALGSNNHKIDYIRTLMQTYSHMPFVLMGDSGQHDPETYWQIAMEAPGRVKGIYLHDLNRKNRDRAVEQIARDLRARGVPVMHSNRVRDYETHMAELGLISPA